MAAAVVLAAGGVAFALLQSQVSLTGNSVTTGTTGLDISPNDTNYSNTYTGFNFSGVIPGSQPSQTEHFLLKNVGSAPLAIRLGISSVPSNPHGVDLSKVHVILTPYSTDTYMPGTPLDFPVQSLVDAGSSGVPVDYPANLAVGMKEEYNLQISMDGDAVNGSNASLSNIDFQFTGIASK